MILFFVEIIIFIQTIEWNDVDLKFNIELP